MRNETHGENHCMEFLQRFTRLRTAEIPISALLGFDSDQKLDMAKAAGMYPTTDRTQITHRPVSSLVGDHQRILAVICFSFFAHEVSILLYRMEHCN